jgi:DNA-binding MarR family transcriptional regulator
MATVDENAFTILRLMHEKGITIGKGITCSELEALTGLDDDEFDQAETYLLHQKFLAGSGGGDRGKRYITPQGIDFVRWKMEARLPLSLEAERVLKYVEKVEPPPIFDSLEREDRHKVHPHDIQAALHLTSEDLAKALRELEDEGLARGAEGASITSGWGIRATPEGRQAIRRNFRILQTPTPQIGAIFQGPVNATNIANIASAINSQIDQTISINDPEAIRQAISETLDSVVASVGDLLDLKQKAAYIETAAKLQQELEKPEPSPTVIQRLMTIISFGDTLDGTLELGQKALTAAVKAAPYTYMLYELIKKVTGLG